MGTCWRVTILNISNCYCMEACWEMVTHSVKNADVYRNMVWLPSTCSQVANDGTGTFQLVYACSVPIIPLITRECIICWLKHRHSWLNDCVFVTMSTIKRDCSCWSLMPWWQGTTIIAAKRFGPWTFFSCKKYRLVLYTTGGLAVFECIPCTLKYS